MKVLLVDNGTHYKKKLLSLFEDDEVTYVAFEDLKNAPKDGYDLIVLSGAYKTYDVKNHGDTIYAPEKELVRSAKVPVIGICLGAQIIAHMYGARLSTVQGNQRIRGVKRIWNVKRTPFDFFPYYGGRVWASQKWRITDLPDELECWCASNEGVEVFKHTKKPIYGLQFHPEYTSQDNDGHLIFNKIIELEFGKAKK
jgi:GMP synthase (glutamine-hydrolysing)